LLVTDILGPIGRPETSVTNYQSALCNNPEEYRSHCLAYVVFGLQGNLQDKLNKFGVICSCSLYLCLCMYLFIYLFMFHFEVLSVTITM